MNEEQIKTLKNMGALSYPPSKIASLMGMNREDVKKLMEDRNSEFYKTYKAGQDYAEYLIDLQLFEMSQSGDLAALSAFEKRREKLQKDEYETYD